VYYRNGTRREFVGGPLNKCFHANFNNQWRLSDACTDGGYYTLSTTSHAASCPENINSGWVGNNQITSIMCYITSAPTTRAPATSAPTTRAPATSAPTTRAPATSAPTTRAPATSALTTRAPATSAPTPVFADAANASGGGGGGSSGTVAAVVVVLLLLAIGIGAFVYYRRKQNAAGNRDRVVLDHVTMNAFFVEKQNTTPSPAAPDPGSSAVCSVVSQATGKQCTNATTGKNSELCSDHTCPSCGGRKSPKASTCNRCARPGSMRASPNSSGSQGAAVTKAGDGHSRKVIRADSFGCQPIPGLKTDYFKQEVDFPTVMLSYQSDSTGVGKGEP
jgi:hypothetical protein